MIFKPNKSRRSGESGKLFLAKGRKRFKMRIRDVMTRPLNTKVTTTKQPERLTRLSVGKRTTKSTMANMVSSTNTTTLEITKSRGTRIGRNRKSGISRGRVKSTTTEAATTTAALNINLSRWLTLKVAKRSGSSVGSTMRPLLASRQTLKLLPFMLAIFASLAAGQQVVSAHKSSSSSSIPVVNTAQTVWDFGTHAPLASRVGLSSAPAFAIEPPSLVEYSNSTGTVIACRPQLSSTTTTSTSTSTTSSMMTIMMMTQGASSNQEQVGSKSTTGNTKQESISEHRLASNTPTAISWRLVKRLPSPSQLDLEDDSSLQQEQDDVTLPLNSSSRLYFVRQDGALVFNPFKAGDFRHDLHLATYKCCLSNRYGSLCSRPVRTRAVLDTSLNVEVFDEFALAQNSLTVKCQVQPTYVTKFVQVVAWLRNDKILITAEQSKQANLALLNNNNVIKKQLINSAQNQKYIMLETGELYIRNVSKQSDFGTYKCRVKNKLTNVQVTSKIGAQLMVDDSQQQQQQQQQNHQVDKSEIKLVNELHRQQLIWREENSDAFICAHVQSIPVASFTWFRQSFNSNERQLISEHNWPEIRHLDSCIYISQLQQKHSADYICEATNGDSSPKSTTSRLIVTSAHLTTQIQIVQAQQLVRGGNDQSMPLNRPPISNHYNTQQLQYQSTIQFGSSVYLNCSISGFPFDTITWYKDAKLFAVSSYYPPQMMKQTTADQQIDINKKRTTDGRVIKTFPNIKLVQETVILIENFGLGDRGVYQCQVYSSQANSLPLNLSQIALTTQLLDQKLVTNGFEQHQIGSNEFEIEKDYSRSASGSIQLEIAFSKPIISQKFPSQSVQRGGQLSLQCVVFGLPAPHVLWFLDNLLISASLSNSRQQQFTTKNTYSTYFNTNDDLELEQQQGENRENQERSQELEPDKSVNQFEFKDIRALEISNLLWNSDQQEALQSAQQNPTTDVDEILSLPPGLNVIEDERFQVRTHLISSKSVTTNNFLNHHHNQQQLREEKQFPSQPMLLSELNVSKLSVSETGQYKCLAINPLGSNQHVGQINVVASNSQSASGTLELRSYQATNVTLIAGKSSILQCPLIGFPVSRVDWFRDGQRLPMNHRQRIEPIKLGFGGKLELKNVDKSSDGGMYTCRVSLATQKSALVTNGSGLSELDGQDNIQVNSGGTNSVQQDDLVGQIQAYIRVAPVIDTQSLPEIKQADEGTRVQLDCSVVKGDHPVKIRWLKRVSDKSKVALIGTAQLTGFELMKNSINEEATSKNEESITIHNLEDSCLLTFKQISYTDSGDYVCLVQNDVSQSMRTTRVIVNVAPSWSNELQSDVNVPLGDRLQLDCSAHGFPQPQVAWKKEVKSNLKVHLPQNEPTWTQQQQHDLLKDSVQSNEYINIISNYHLRAYLNGSLIIDQVDQSDGGIFMCEVGNGVGTGLSRVVRVEVDVPPYFKHRSSAHLGQLGTRAELKCAAFGDHPMLIGWRKDNEIVDLVNDNRHRSVREHKLASQSFESILTIDNLTRLDSGQYVCIASNEFGSEEMKIQLIVQEPPEEPSLMRPIRATSRQATLTLRPPYSGNSPIRKYAIIFKQMDISMNNNNNNENNSTFVKPDLINWQQILVDAPQSNDVITTAPTFASPIKSINNSDSSILLPININTQQLVSLNLCCLQPFTRYLVRVKAINEIGSSEPSKPIQFITDEEVIGGPPVDVSVEATGAHSLKVRWRSPAKNLQNGLIRGYYIGYRAINSPGSPVAGPSSSNPLLIENLKSSLQSSPNIKVFELMESEQYQYKNVQLDVNSLNLRQFNLNIPELMQDTTSFMSLLHNSNSSSSILPSQPQVFTSYLTNLRRKTAYSIIVQAYNKIGAGPRSDSITVSTLDAAPPMSPILKLISTSFDSAQLIWSSRKFDNNKNHENTTTNGNFPSKLRVFNFEEPLEDDEDDDPQSYYTINFKTLDEKSAAQMSSNVASQQQQDDNDDDWQQRKVQKRQQLPYILSNLKCGSHYAAFMTATNSLGQSEPGEAIKFTTLGAAPIAPSNSREFFLVNSTYVILHLSEWQNAGCIINSFTFKFKSANQVKWNILEHQVYPTIQTVTIAGAAVFSVQSNNILDTNNHMATSATDNRRQQQQHQYHSETWLSHTDNKQQRQISQSIPMLARQQAFNDFVIRNLLTSTTYKLIVEASSEAGLTSGEYEFETGNFTSSTLSINVNGISADNSIVSIRNKNGRMELDSPDMGELDFSYSGGQRALNPFQKYNIGVWSLTTLFVIASIFMAITTLILGFRSIIRMKSFSSSRDSLISAMLCCSNSSSSSSGADSSHSSSAGTCYQVSEHPIDPYYTLSSHGLMLTSDLTPTRTRLNGGTATISGHLDSCDGGELKSIMGDPLPFRQLASSSSLSTIGAKFNRQGNSQQQVRHTHTLGGAAHFQAAARRFSNDEASANHMGSHYAATLGKQHSTFMPSSNNLQPIKYNNNNNTINNLAPLYGRLQAKQTSLSNNDDCDGQQQQQLLYPTNNNPNAENYQQFHHPMSSCGTSGYDTNNSIKMSSDVDRQSQQPIYMQGGNPVVAAAATAYQMNMYGTTMTGSGTVDTGTGNLFEQAVNNNTSNRAVTTYEQDSNSMNGLNRDQSQGQFHYNLSGEVGRNVSCQQQQQLADAAVYGIIYGANQQVMLGQNEQSTMKQLDQQQQQQFDQQQSQELNHHLALIANQQQQ